MHVLDTGPIFKFLATNCVDELLRALGYGVISVPSAVEFEIFDTPKRRPQFAKAPEAWKRLPERFKEVLSDKEAEEMQQCCRQVFGRDLQEMYSEYKDRGENMAILHGVRLAKAGHDVLIVCDDEAGTQLIRNQANRLAMECVRGKLKTAGRIRPVDTLTLLRWAIEEGGFNGDISVFLKKYAMMVELDEALPRDIKATGLTRRPPWP